MATLQKDTCALSIIIINYKTPDLTLSVVNMLDLSPETELIVVDNSPTSELKDNLSQKKQLTYIKNSKNIGFAAAVNQAANQSRGEWLVLLNSDTKTDIKALQKLITIAEKHDAQVAAPQLVHDNQVEKSVGYFDSFTKHPLNSIFARPRAIEAHSNEPIWVDLATGGVLLIKRTLFNDIGQFDALQFFMYFEDIDLSYRLKQAGISILHVPEVKIEHLGGKSADQDKIQKQKNYQHSLQNYLAKHKGKVILRLNNLIHAFS
ncbi:MAG: glycosyltransferase family 2 protein [Weeksellaceae bacterium]